MTTWVQVPVPEDMEDAVRDLVSRLSFSAALAGWDAESIDAHLRSLDPAARALACLVAERLVAGSAPDDVELAQELGLSRRELRGLLQEVNDPTIDPSPGGLLWVKSVRVPDEVPPRNRGEVHMLDRYTTLICGWQAANGPVAPAASK